QVVRALGDALRRLSGIAGALGERAHVELQPLRARREALERAADRGGGAGRERSEEHTSELQSHLNLVCRLLLEKKKTDTNYTNPRTSSARPLIDLSLAEDNLICSDRDKCSLQQTARPLTDKLARHDVSRARTRT